MSKKYYLDWKEFDDLWSVNDYIWIDVAILIEETVGEILGGNYDLILDDIDPWDTMERKMKDKKVEDKKINQLLEVIVSVKGEEKRFKKEIKDPSKITINDIQKTLDKYSKNKILVKAKIKGL